MDRVRVILWKEWLELRTQRGMLISLAIVPLVFSLMPIAISYLMAQTADVSGSMNTQGIPPGILNSPLFAGLNEREIAQAMIGQQFGTLFLMMPLILPSIIAAYSVVGEKAGRTLEPLLATPISTWELLLAKSLAALIPAVALTWLSGLIYIAGMWATAVSARAFAAIITPGWLIVFLLCAPLAALCAIAMTVAVSSRVNDPRSAQQLSAVFVLPLLGLFFAQIFGALVLSPSVALLIALVLALAAAALIRLATALFRREVILTRWT